MSKRILLAAVAALCTFAAQAENGDTADIKKAVEAALGKGAKVDSVRDAGALGLYEVVVGGDVLYTDKKASHLVIGDIVDLKSRRNLTEERKNKLSQIKFSELPLDLAIKQVRGNGKRVFATFEDPNCSYCKKLAKEIQNISDVTVYTFMLPVLSPDSIEKSKNIWCAPDRAKAWNDWMLRNTEPPAAKCDDPTEKVSALGRKLNVRGTPAIFFADGSRVPGFIPASSIEQALAKASK